MKNNMFGECLGEVIGTFIFMFIGTGTVASLVAAGTNITYWNLSICWGLAITIAVFIVGLVSGAHLNPSVTIALAAWKGFDKKKVVPYIISQIIGAFLAAALTYGLYGKVITTFESSKNIVRASNAGWATAGIFTTFPKSGLTMFNAFMVEVCITAFLVLVIFAVSDGRNESCPKAGFPALAIGLTVAFIGVSFGPLTGFSMNFARDFGPRLFCMMAGWGTSVLGPNGYGLIVPLFAPIIGGLIGGGIYEKLVAPYLPGVVNAKINESESV
ncbi:MIP family channel protein [Clostridiaceae bacterium UIB06]|uniref:MIP family channel protein n=1 Tax=Clostridium thailandense TaxID=2794346 RepID=A0A949X4Z4_9CLOT|nr:MIP family channel protein [Clostridium thailandense]MBV7274803.1 MIP family channel protein [Clostridium thailandense]MCH5137264.1 MIP family channel protein [Clostridiaceae bacterium UIB06]